MFCPNCGKDSGDFKFCPHCGTKIPEAEQQSAVWSVGMACPHCGGTKLDGNNCAFCGAQLMVDVPQGKDEEWDSYEIPYREFVAGYSKIELKKDELLIKYRLLFLSSKTIIPYVRLVEAEFDRAEDYKGKITFRWTKSNSATGQDGGAELEETSIDLYEEDNTFFLYQMFYVIKLLAPNAKYTLNSPPVDQTRMEQFGRSVNLNELFIKYAPCRELAAAELASKCMIPPEEAKAFVHTLFDVRLRETYEVDPRLAARDYNRMMRFRRQQYEEWKKERFGDDHPSNRRR